MTKVRNLSAQAGEDGLVGITTSNFGEQQRFMLLLIAPAALLMLLFQVVPIASAPTPVFATGRSTDPKKTWVGLDHYTAVITDPAFL